MSLDKAIKHGKEHRRMFEEYSYMKSVDPTCRNHGDDFWARDNRTFFDKSKRLNADMKMSEGIREYFRTY